MEITLTLRRLRFPMLMLGLLISAQADAAETRKLGEWLDWSRAGEDEKVLSLLWVGPDKKPSEEEADDLRKIIRDIRANPKTKVVSEYGNDRVRWLAITDGTTTIDPIYMIYVDAESRWKIVSDSRRNLMPLTERERFLFEKLFDDLEKLYRKAPPE
jgi:hypothetical protein